MLRSVFTKWLWDTRRSLLGWAVAIAAVGTMYAAFWPSIRNPEMMKALEAYPKSMLEALNFDDVGTAAGYLSSAVYGLLVSVLMAVFAIAAGTRAVAGDEEAGTLDLILAHPVGRTRLALQRVAALTVGIGLVGAALWLAMLALRGPAQLDGVSPGALAATTLQLVLFAVTFGALAFAIGAATGRKALTLGVSGGVAVFAFLANGLIPQVDGLEWVRNLSFWHWYLGGEPLVNGLQVGDCALLAATTVGLVASGTWAFNRRDVAV